MPASQPWYWTPKQLEKLCWLLNRAAKQDEEGHYFGGPLALNAYVIKNGERAGLANLTEGRVKMGLALLCYLGVLEPGKPGVKALDHKRRYYPEKARSVSNSDVNRFRQEVVGKSPRSSRQR